MPSTTSDIENEGRSSNDSAEDGVNGGSSGKLWSVYLSIADKQDTALVETWKGNADGTLIFTGLFSATVAAFIIASYKSLSADSGDTAVILLGQILQQLSSNGSIASFPQSPSPFRPSASAIRVNILAVRHLTNGRASAHLFDGIERYRFSEVVEAVPALLHIAVFLFFAGLVEFLFHINHSVAGVVVSFVAACAGFYILLTVFPYIHSNIPYRTPFSAVPIKRVSSPLMWLLSHRPAIRPLSETLSIKQLKLDRKALWWTLATLGDDDDLESFVDGIPGFLRSDIVKQLGHTIESFLYTPDAMNPLLLISRLLQTSIHGTRGLKEPARRRRALTCINALRNLTDFLQPKHDYFVLALSTWDILNLYKSDPDRAISLNAYNAGALVAYHLLQMTKAGRIKYNRAASIALIDPSYELMGQCDERDEVICNGDIINIIGFVTGIVPHLLSKDLSDTDLDIVWETLATVTWWVDFTPAATSRPVQTAFLELWDDVRDLAKSKTKTKDYVPTVVRVRSAQSLRTAPLPRRWEDVSIGDLPRDRWTRSLDMLRPVADWCLLDIRKKDPDPEIALSAFVRSAHAAQHFLRKVDEGIIAYSSDMFLDLMDPPPWLRNQFVESNSPLQDGSLINVACLVSGVLPLLQLDTPPLDTKLDLLWDTLFQLRVGLTPAASSHTAQPAFLELWDNVHRLAWMARQPGVADPTDDRPKPQGPASSWSVLVEYLRPIAEALPDAPGITVTDSFRQGSETSGQ